MEQKPKPKSAPLLRVARPETAAGFASGSAKRLTVAQIIYKALRADILELRLSPGLALSEKDLIQRFGCSRTPLREALIRLTEEQLVVIFPQSGTYVSRIRRASLPSAVVVRQALECAAVEHAMARLDQQTLHQLNAIIDQQRACHEAKDQPGFHAADEAFHAAMADAAGHPLLWHMAEMAKTEIDRCRRLALPVPGRMAQVMIEHQHIVDCMRAGDASGAIRAMRLHLQSVVPDAEALVQKHPDFFI